MYIDPYVQNHAELMHSIKPAAQYLSVSVVNGITVGGAAMTALCQRCACRSTCQPARQTTVCDECHCMACLLRITLLLHYVPVHWLRVPQQTHCKLFVPVFWCFHALPYLANKWTMIPERHCDVCQWRHSVSYDDHLHHMPQWTAH